MQIVSNCFVNTGRTGDSVWLLEEERDRICDYDLINLNCNNNSSPVNTHGFRCGAVVSLSHSSVYSNGQNAEEFRNKALSTLNAQHSSLQRRHPANKPRARRHLRQGLSNPCTILKGESNVQAYLGTRGQKNRNLSCLPEDASQTTVPNEITHTKPNYAAKTNLQRVNSITDGRTRKIPGLHSPIAVSTNGQRAASGQLKGEYSNSTGNSCRRLSIYQALERVFQYRSVSDIPQILKNNLIQSVCQHLVDRGLGDNCECVLSRLMDVCRKPGEQNPTVRHNADRTGQDKKHEKEISSDPSRETVDSIARPSYQYGAKPETRLDNTARPDSVFTSNEVFQAVYGTTYRTVANYWKARPPVLPSRLFRYKTMEGGAVQVIGTGTFAEVVVATMNINGHTQDIVLKEPYSDMVTKDQVFDEAKITMSLEPTGYVPICYGLVLDSAGSPNIVLELFGSGTLKEVFVQRQLSRSQWLSIACQLAEGLSRIHDMDILVNDIKADNVLVDVSGLNPLVKFCDMGCSSYKHGISFDDANMDFFHHLAPEVRSGGHTSKSNDVYGLGKLLDRIVQLSLISGLVPISERCLCLRQLDRITAKTALELMMALLREEEDITSNTISCEPDQSSSDLSLEGYDPDSGVSSDDSPSRDAPAPFFKTHRAGFCTEVYHTLSNDYQQARDEVYEKMCSSSNLDKLCLALFVLLSVVLVFYRSS